LVAEGTRRELVAQLGDRIERTATGDLGAPADRCRHLDGIDRRRRKCRSRRWTRRAARNMLRA
jgi:hypothetical protein